MHTQLPSLMWAAGNQHSLTTATANDPVAGFKCRDSRSHLVDDARLHVPKSCQARRGQIALQNVQISSAHGGLVDFYNCIRRRCNLRLGPISNAIFLGP